MKYIKFLSVLLSVAFFTSCADYLDKAPEEDITFEQAFQKPAYAEAFLSSAYAGLPNEMWFSDWGDANPYVMASDDLAMPYPEKFGKLITSGAWNAYNASGQQWINMAESIRKVNIFLNYIHLTPFDQKYTQAKINNWIGEAILLRALCHFFSLRIYGPIPILDHKIELNEDFNALKRQPLDDCIQFILDECDRTIEILPVRITNTADHGRMNAGAAYALKARLLLYRASPLFNGNPDYRNFADKEGVKLFPQENDPSYWQKAAEAAKKCIEECEKVGYKLYDKSDGDRITVLKGIFIDRNNEETILPRNVGYDGGIWGLVEKCCFPRTNGGWAGTNPTQNLVDAFEMTNGIKPIQGYQGNGRPILTPGSGYVEEGYTDENDPEGRWKADVRKMYTNRDPRFYAWINFNGKEFKGRQIEWYNSGPDGRGNESRDYNCTGYTMNKYVNEDSDIHGGLFQRKSWIFFRMAEIYLNYAEALNEWQGPVADVYTYVNKIRTRAGMPDLPANLSKEDMRQRIRDERRVELCFETHRYFDCRRWKIAPETDNGPIYGMNITAGTSLRDDAFFERVVTETRIFRAPVHYLFPIIQDEIDKNQGLVQNPGW